MRRAPCLYRFQPNPNCSTKLKNKRYFSYLDPVTTGSLAIYNLVESLRFTSFNDIHIVWKQLSTQAWLFAVVASHTGGSCYFKELCHDS